MDKGVILFGRRGTAGLKEALKGIPLIPATILTMVVAAGVLGPFIVPYNPVETNLLSSFLPPIWKQGGV